MPNGVRLHSEAVQANRRFATEGTYGVACSAKLSKQHLDLQAKLCVLACSAKLSKQPVGFVSKQGKATLPCTATLCTQRFASIAVQGRLMSREFSPGVKFSGAVLS